MKNVLKIQASLFGADGQSSRLADRYIESLQKQHRELRLVTRDLAAQPVPPLTAERFQALLAKPEDRSAEQQTIVDYSDALVAELNTADVVVFAVPMYNLNIPAGLQNYFDHIARAGVTFRYTANGPEGLIKGIQVAVFIARGGNYGEDHSHTMVLRQFLSLIGLNDARFFHAEGLSISDESREQSLAAVKQEIAKVTQPLASVA